MPSKRSSALTTKAVAVVAVLAGIALIVVEVRRVMRGVDYQIVFWGLIAVAAIGLGLYELFGPKEPADSEGAAEDEAPPERPPSQPPRDGPR